MWILHNKCRLAIFSNLFAWIRLKTDPICKAKQRKICTLYNHYIQMWCKNVCIFREEWLYRCIKEFLTMKTHTLFVCVFRTTFQCPYQDIYDGMQTIFPNQVLFEYIYIFFFLMHFATSYFPVSIHQITVSSLLELSWERSVAKYLKNSENKYDSTLYINKMLTIKLRYAHHSQVFLKIFI